MRRELKKLFSSRLMLVCIIVTAILFGVFVFRSVKYYSIGNEVIDERRRFIAEVSEGRSRTEIGAFLSQRINELNGQIKDYDNEPPIELMNELFMCINVQDKLAYIEKEFPKHRRALIYNAIAAAERERMKPEPNQSVITLNELAAEKYNRIIDLKLTESGKLRDLLISLDNIYWDYAMMLLAVIIAVRMFTLDRTCGAYRVLNTKIKSRGRLFLSQLLSAFSVTAVIIILTAVCQLTVGMTCFGISDLSLPIQQFEGFEHCPHSVTLGGFLLSKLAMKLLFYLFVTALAAMLSVLLKKPQTALPAASLAVILPQILMTVLFVYTTEENASALDGRYIAFDRLRCILPQSFLNLKTYFFRFDYVTVFGIALPRMICAAAVTCGLTAVCIFTAYRKFARPAR